MISSMFFIPEKGNETESIRDLIEELLEDLDDKYPKIMRAIWE